MKRVGILYHPLSERAQALSQKLEDLLSSRGVSSWQCSTHDEETARPSVSSTDLILSIGGDGTILRAARIIIPSPVPILGINLGKLGFITEISGDEALSSLPGLLEGKGWTEERAMVEAVVDDQSFHALNDVVLRSKAVRLVNIEAEVDGAAMATYRADGVIAATATGSTAYSLASGGPILHPLSRNIVLQPVSCHLGLSHAVVLPPQSTVNLRVAHRDRIVLCIDGQVEVPMSEEQHVMIRLSSNTVRFLRIHEPSYFYSLIGTKLRGGATADSYRPS